MIIVYRADAKHLLEQELYAKALSGMPAGVQQKIAGYKLPEDRAARLGGRFLLKQLLEDHDVNGWASITADATGRLFIPGSAASFSITHAGLDVLVAYSGDATIGIDAETLRPLNINEVADYFGPEEWKIITSAPVPANALLHCWTRKEAVLKAAGLGLAYPLHTLNTLPESVIVHQKTWYLAGLGEQHNICVHVASNLQGQAILSSIQEIL